MSRANPPPPCAYWAPGPLALQCTPLSHEPCSHHAFIVVSAGPANIEPRRLKFRFRVLNRPPSCILGPRASSPLMCLSVAYNMLPPRFPVCSTLFPPISSPSGSNFGFAHYTALPHVYWALGLLALQWASLTLKMLPPGLSNRSPLIPPISSLSGWNFGFAR